MKIKEFKNLYLNDNFYILDKYMHVIMHQHNVVNVDGIVFIYLLLAQQESTGLTWIEFWNDGIFQSRQQILPNELTIDENTGLDILHVIPLATGMTFNTILIYGGSSQTQVQGTGYNFATIVLSQTYIKFPNEYIQTLWNLQINSNEQNQLFTQYQTLLFSYGIVSQ